MKVTIKLFANLRKYLPEGSDGQSCMLEVDDNITVGQLLKKINIPEDTPLVILVNYTHAHKDRILENGDVLSIFPPIAGGSKITSLSS